MAKEPLLDLSTLIDSRPSITVDGVTYHLKSPEELSLRQSQEFTSWGKELEELAAEPKRIEALEALVGIVAWAALADLPIGVFNKLSSGQRMAIIELFTGLLMGRRLRLAGALAKQLTSGRTGVNSSPDSSSPMAATPAGGSTPSLQPS